MSNKYHLFSVVGIAMFCALAFFGVAATPAFAATSTVANPPAPHMPNNRNAPPQRFCQPNLGYRNQGASVRQLQMDLNRWGFRGRSGRALQINGQFDDDTLFAVRQFQFWHHRPANGYVDAITWRLLGECGQR